MMTRDPRALRSGRAAAMAGLCLLLTQAGCNLKSVGIPGLSGPSELSLSLDATATPDSLVADDVSTSLVQVFVRNQNGQPFPGQAISFIVLDGQGNPADIGSLSANSAAADGNGIARVIYRAPARTDFTANGSVLIGARPVGSDFNGQRYRTVRIELRAAETHLFPQIPGDKPPTCQFITEPPAGGSFQPGFQVLFQDTSFDPDGRIVRYHWDFGDGGSSDAPDVNHAYGFAGSFTVTHVVTDNAGLQQACTLAIAVF